MVISVRDLTFEQGFEDHRKVLETTSLPLMEISGQLAVEPGDVLELVNEVFIKNIGT